MSAASIRTPMPDFDPGLILAALSPEEADVILGFVEEFGLQREEWTVLPPTRLLLETVAVLRAGAEVRGVESAIERMKIGAEELGVPETDEGPHPADTVIQRLYRWRRRATEAHDDKMSKYGDGDGVVA